MNRLYIQKAEDKTSAFTMLYLLFSKEHFC